MILDLLLSERTPRSAFWWTERERKKRDQNLCNAFKRVLCSSACPTMGYVLDKIQSLSGELQ